MAPRTLVQSHLDSWPINIWLRLERKSRWDLKVPIPWEIAEFRCNSLGILLAAYRTSQFIGLFDWDLECQWNPVYPVLQWTQAEKPGTAPVFGLPNYQAWIWLSRFYSCPVCLAEFKLFLSGKNSPIPIKNVRILVRNHKCPSGISNFKIVGILSFKNVPQNSKIHQTIQPNKKPPDAFEDSPVQAVKNSW